MLKAVPIQSHHFPRVGDEPNSEDALRIDLGAYEYEVVIVDEPWTEDGERRATSFNAAEQRIEVARHLAPAKRWAACWVQLANAWYAEFDICQDPTGSYAEDTVSNLVSVAMAHTTPTTMLRLWVYLFHGVAVDRDAMMNDAFQGMIARVIGGAAKLMRKDH